jgi:hypothetical protein
VGRGKRKYDAPLQPNGKPTYRSANASWDMANKDYIDVTTFGSTNKTYLVSSANTGYSPTIVNWGDPMVSTATYAPDGDRLPFSLEGSFQGRYFQVVNIDMLTDSPIEEVMRAVLGLFGDDELLGISYRTSEGEVKVRPWNVDE